MAKNNNNTPPAQSPEATTTEVSPEVLIVLKNQIEALEAELKEKDALIDELLKQVETQDTSSLEVPKYPTVKHLGKTYQVRAKRFRLKGDPRIYEVSDLKDPELVAKLVEQKSGFMVAE
jgi:hypothetical protein